MNRRYGRLVTVLLALLLAASLSGCARYRGMAAFEEAEELLRAEQYDRAVEKYFEATETDPGNMTFKLKLSSGRTRAAAHHINRARALAREEQLDAALSEYRLARGFDPSLEVAALEERQLQEQVNARALVEEGFARYQAKDYPAARRLVNEALALAPQQARARELQQLLDARRQVTVMDGIELDIASDEPLTLRFKQTNIKEVINIIGKLSGINFIVDEELKNKTITVLLEKATFSQAMELLLQMGGVKKKVLNPKTILIYPDTKDKGKQYEDQLVQVFYLSHIEAKKAVNMLRTMLQLRKIYVHEERNALVIRDTPPVIRLAEQILLAADRADSEVLFDIEVLTVREGDTLKLGPKLKSYVTTFGVGQETTATGGATTVTIPDSITLNSLNDLRIFYTIPSATFDLAKTLSSAEILASPKIRVKNNEKAKIHIGNRDPVVTTTTIAGSDNQVSQTVQYVDSGIKLDIEPNVQLDGSVLAKITLEVSSAQRLNANDQTGQSPVALTTTNAQTSLVLVDGVRTILGGLYENTATRNKTTFPFLGSIPLLGSLLTNFDNADTKREILLSITPYVVKRVDLPKATEATIWSGGEDDLMAGAKFAAFARPLQSEVEATTPAPAPGVRSAPPRGAPRPAGPAATPPSAAPPAPTPDAEELLDAEAMLDAEGVPDVQEIPEQGNGVPVIATPPAAATPPPAAAPGPGRLALAAPGTIAVGEEFLVEVQVAEVTGLFSAPLFVRYDPALLEFVTAGEGDFLGLSGEETVFSFSPAPEPGQLVVGNKQQDAGPGESGSGTLFMMAFRAKAPGTARIELDRINFRDREGGRIEVAPVATSIAIQ